MELLGIGIPELLVIIVLALIVVGPERLPEVMVRVARTIRELREYATNITSEFNTAIEEMQEEFKDVTDAAGEGMRSVNAEMAALDTDVRTAASIDTPVSTVAATEEPATSNGETAVADPESATASPGTTAGVASLEEIRRRVLRSSNGAVTTPSHGSDDSDADGKASGQ